MDNPFDSDPIHHNYNIGKVFHLAHLLDQSLLLILRILLAVSTMIELLAATGDLAFARHSLLTEHTMATAEPSKYDYTMVVDVVV